MTDWGHEDRRSQHRRARDEETAALLSELSDQIAELSDQVHRDRKKHEDTGSMTVALDRKARNLLAGAVLIALFGGNGTNLAKMYGLIDGAEADEHGAPTGLVKMLERIETNQDAHGDRLDVLQRGQDRLEDKFAEHARRIESLERSRDQYYSRRAPGAAHDAPATAEQGGAETFAGSAPLPFRPKPLVPPAALEIPATAAAGAGEGGG